MPDTNVVEINVLRAHIFQIDVIKSVAKKNLFATHDVRSNVLKTPDMKTYIVIKM